MKKLLFLISACLLTIISCQRTKQHIPTEDWKDYRKAYAFLNNQRDSAFYYFNQAAIHAKDSLQIGMAYNNMGIIQSDAGDNYGSEESLSFSLRFLNEQDKRTYNYLADAYNELGITSFNLKKVTIYELGQKGIHEIYS